ncbi:MAG: hypothetical protein JWN52_1974 [Actinomycetia bacterium]|nr:hypothetical protein [Actinomycetes bacterium]
MTREPKRAIAAAELYSHGGVEVVRCPASDHGRTSGRATGLGARRPPQLLVDAGLADQVRPSLPGVGRWRYGSFWIVLIRRGRSVGASGRALLVGLGARIPGCSLTRPVFSTTAPGLKKVGSQSSVSPGVGVLGLRLVSS